MIFPQIRPDEPGTKPGDPGNGRVLVIDAKHQKFNGHKYHLKKGYYVCTINEKQYRLHADVWAYHNGSLPDGYIVHHDHRNLDGSFDKNENNIEWLRLMTPSEHSLYHAKNKAPVKKIDPNSICPLCARPFKVPKTSRQVTCSPEHEEVFYRFVRAQDKFYRERLGERRCLITFINTMLDIKIRCLLIDGEAWFIAKDVCDVLDLVSVSQAVKKIAAGEKDRISFPTAGGVRPMIIINVWGLLRLTMKRRRRTLEAEIFGAWISHIIIPALYLMRKYQLNGASSPPWFTEDTDLTIEPYTPVAPAIDAPTITIEPTDV